MRWDGREMVVVKVRNDRRCLFMNPLIHPCDALNSDIVLESSIVLVLTILSIMVWRVFMSMGIPLSR